MSGPSTKRAYAYIVDVKDRHAAITVAAGGRELYREPTIQPRLDLACGYWRDRSVADAALIRTMTTVPYAERLAAIGITGVSRTTVETLDAEYVMVRSPLGDKFQPSAYPKGRS